MLDGFAPYKGVQDVRDIKNERTHISILREGKYQLLVLIYLKTRNDQSGFSRP